MPNPPNPLKASYIEECIRQAKSSFNFLIFLGYFQILMLVLERLGFIPHNFWSIIENIPVFLAINTCNHQINDRLNRIANGDNN